MDKKHPDRCNVREAKSDKITESMLRLCNERHDDWAFEVKGRLLTCGDLHAVDAVYHSNCHRKFSRTGFGSGTEASVGRSADCDMSSAFNVLCSTLESCDNEVYTVSELIELMKLLSGDESSLYSSKYMKRKLQSKFLLQQFSNIELQ